MAFIRQYAEEAGDGLFKRLGKFARRATKQPKALRRVTKQITWKNAGRLLRTVAPAALAIAAPGIGTALEAAQQFVGRREPAPSDPVLQDRPAYGGLPPDYGLEVTAPRLPQFAAPSVSDDEPEDEEESSVDDPDDYDDDQGDPVMMEEFLRGYHGMAGDARKPKATNTLARAGTSPKQKAAAKKTAVKKQQARSAGAAAASSKTKKSTGPKIDMGRLAAAAAGGLPFVGGLASDLTNQLTHQGGGGGAFGRKRHRSMNPANVRALRRGIRRIEGFEKLVKRVEKAFPRLKRAHTVHAAPHHKKGR